MSFENVNQEIPKSDLESYIESEFNNPAIPSEGVRKQVEFLKRDGRPIDELLKQFGQDSTENDVDSVLWYVRTKILGEDPDNVKNSLVSNTELVDVLYTVSLNMTKDESKKESSGIPAELIRKELESREYKTIKQEKY